MTVLFTVVAGDFVIILILFFAVCTMCTISIDNKYNTGNN